MEIARKTTPRDNDHMTAKELLFTLENLPKTERMPLLFVGHGSPMNGIEDNQFVRGWQELGRTLPRPTAILAISAHWQTRGTEVHIAERPRMIYDFWGFPEELYTIVYPCLGAPLYAKATKNLMTDVAKEDTTWGIDHGTWIVLRRMYPDASIPVFQMSLDMNRSPQSHYQLAKELALLRERGVLILGSGNLVHNLREIDFEKQDSIYPWAADFDGVATRLILEHKHDALIDYEKLGSAARLAIPTPEHYWPLLYILGLQQDDEGVSFPIEGISNGSISMRSVLIK